MAYVFGKECTKAQTEMQEILVFIADSDVSLAAPSVCGSFPE